MFQQLRGLARRVPWGYLLRGIVQFAIVAVAFGIHELLRGLVAGTTSQALANGRGVINAERTLGIFWELDVQHWALAHREALKVLDFSYLHLHMPMLALFGLWVAFFHQDKVRDLRNIFIGTVVVAIPTYWLFPLAPPRFFPEVGFVDTVKLFTGTNFEGTKNILSNSYAAMPSLHASWALFIAIGLVYVKRKPIYLLGLLYWVLICTSILASANHWVLDAIAGSALTILCFLLVPPLVALLPWSVERRRERTRARLTTASAAVEGSSAADEQAALTGPRRPRQAEQESTGSGHA